MEHATAKIFDKLNQNINIKILKKNTENLIIINFKGKLAYKFGI